MSNGLAVATSRYESVWPTGSTVKRRASCSGTAWIRLGSTRDMSATGNRKRAASAARIWSSPASFRCTTVSHSDTGASEGSSRSSASASAGSNGSMLGTSHSSKNFMGRPGLDAESGNLARATAWTLSQYSPPVPIHVDGKPDLAVPQSDPDLPPDQRHQPLPGEAGSRPHPAGTSPGHPGQRPLGPPGGHEGGQGEAPPGAGERAQ